MKCPFCGSENTKVVDKRISENNENRRRRECSDCSKRFTTYEKIDEIKREDIQHIKKRDGSVVLFNPKKIREAIFKAAVSVGGKDRKISEELTKIVVEKVKTKFDNKNIPSVEDIQDIVEDVLIDEGHSKTAKAYILYRSERKKIREMKSFFLDIDSTISEYLNQDHWNVKENSNEAFSFSGLLLHVAGKVISNYALNGIYTPQIAKAHRLGYIHIHDMPNAIIGYCCGHSLKNLLLWGFGGVPNKVDARPAKHIDVVVHQMINYIGCLQMEFAGAQAFSGTETLLAPFVKVDNLNYKQVKQNMQKLIYSLNIPSRWAAQYPFSNLTFDWVVPEEMKNQKAIVGGKEQDFTYADCQKEMDMLNKAFLEVMLEGDANGRIFTFPIPTYNVTKDFNWDSENAKLLFEVTAKYGIPYFQNYVGSGLDPRSIHAMCCRLNINKLELINRPGSMWGPGDSTGCYSDDTELLTEGGWKLFKHLKENDKVITLNNKREIEFNKPKKYFKYSYKGDMYNFKSDNMDLLVTPNHRMFLYKHKKLYFKRADEITRKAQLPTSEGNTNKNINFFILPKTMNSWISGNHNSKISKKWDALRIKMDEWLRFLGIYLSEGSIDSKHLTARDHGYRVIISQKKKDIKNQIRDLLNRLPFNFSEYKGGFIIYNKQLYEYVKQFGKCDKKFIPNEIFKCSKKQLRILLDWLIKGDGYYHKWRGTPYYWTTSQQLVSDFQRLAINCGFNVNTFKSKNKVSFIKNRKINSQKTCWILTILRAKSQNIMKIDKIKYNGLVYCVEVKNNNVLVKRNNKISWSGNSIGVCTINMNRIAYESETREDFFNKLEYYMTLAKDSLEIKRKIVNKNLKSGLMPYTKRYLGTFDNHFSTIGLCGMHEACLNFLGQSIGTPEGKEFTIETLKFMRKVITRFQRETDNLYNLEATPAESTSYRFARLDKEMYPDIIVSGEKDLFLTNSTHLPVDATDDAIEAIEHQNDIQHLYTGGTIFHAFLGEKMSSGEACKQLVKKIVYNTRLPYFSITPTFSICKEHGYLKGEQFKCPTCNKETEVYSRIVGYFRPVQNWNAGKREEFRFRKVFDENKTMNSSVEIKNKPEIQQSVIQH